MIIWSGQPNRTPAFTVDEGVLSKLGASRKLLESGCQVTLAYLALSSQLGEVTTQRGPWTKSSSSCIDMCPELEGRT